MKINNPLDAILDNESKVKILRFLIKTKAQWNGRQIAKEIGVTPATTHKALRALYREGVLGMQNIGKTHIYKLNSDNYLVSGLLQPLFAKEDKVLDCIMEIIIKMISASPLKEKILGVALFGSVNLRKDLSTSDIDLAVIVRNEEDKNEAAALFEEIDKKISYEFGNTISPYINTRMEFVTKHKKGLGVLKDIMKNHALVYGKELKALL